MKYCSDTWFILKLFEKDIKALNLLNEVKYGKSSLIVPIVVFAEAIRKLLERGIPQTNVDQFFNSMELSNKINFLIVDKNIAKEAAKISLSNDLSLMDSFVAASCKLSDSNLLLAADSDYKHLIKKNYIKLHSW